MSSDAILEQAARDGSIDITEWPRVLENVLQKLHDIVHSEFPIPSLPPPASLPPTIDPEVIASTPPPATRDHDSLPDADENEAPPNSQSSTKENDEPTDIAARRTAAQGFEVNHAHQPAQPPDSIEAESGTLPPDLLSSYQSSTRVLERDFSQSPPYTIQRLAELVLYPRRHYRFLPAYLRALDRTVSVTSPHSDFPLPSLTATVNGGFLANGDGGGSITEREGLGSDESLGGALLTPILWLRNGGSAPTSNGAAGTHDGELHSERTETIEGPRGAGSVETVSVTVNGVPSATNTLTHTSSAPASPTLSEQSDASTSSTASQESTTDAQLRQQGGVTQGELLRQEQEAGVVPVTQISPRRSLISGGGGGGAVAAVGREPVATAATGAGQLQQRDTLMDERPPEETPHARGPGLIGMEDMGPQQHPLGGGGAELDMEAAVGRSHSPPRAAQQQPSQPLGTQQQQQVPGAAQADAVMEEAGQDDAGEAGTDPKDAEKEAERSKEEMEAGKRKDAKDGDGDVVVADADGRPAEDVEKKEGVEDLSAPEGAEAASR
ncbi:hypothetical protein B0A55_03275 [Friedmanniomyces simplex]|uniref:Protein phosphatase 4 core regulatory subunit R2 n=1 Tax=Friedmanniomyces simplex TaxID=329884 RepID=A0A4U0XLD3_9PEZI|nr:hypothetical protein B0A55_03275 [Friedmanniomyces simplex]